MASSKKRGIKSSAQDNFLQPDPVTGLSGTNVGTGRAYNNGAVNLSWTLPATSPAATAYIITTTPATTTVNTGSSSTSYTFTGLAGGTSYTFTVRGTNNAGTANSNPATDTTGSIAVTTVPAAPASPSASATSANNNTITWSAFNSTTNGGSTVTSIRITGSDGSSYTGISGSATSYVANDPGSSPGSQSYSIYATNALGESSAATTSTISTTPPFFPFFPPFFPFFPPFFPFFPPFFPFFPFFPPFFPFFPPFFPFFPFFPPFFPFFPPYFPFFPFFPPFFPSFSGGGGFNCGGCSYSYCWQSPAPCTNNCGC